MRVEPAQSATGQWVVLVALEARWSSIGCLALDVLAGWCFDVGVVTSTSTVYGLDVAQLYVTYPTTSELLHPPLMLKVFAKVHDFAPSAREIVTLHLNQYVTSY